ncbi:RNA helicase [Malassezia sp. CBS 17886]|nr:RNA helicase [Malassezia sp. CBS 17886]
MPPLSVEDLLREQQAKSAQAKVRDEQGRSTCLRIQPRFVSKKEREQHRAREQEAEDAAEAEKLNQLKRSRVQWERDGRGRRVETSPAGPPSEPSHQTRGAGDRRGGGGGGRRPPEGSPRAEQRESDAQTGLEEREQLQIRQRYLGVRPENHSSRKTRRTGDASKRFLFEWDKDEDTSDQASLALLTQNAMPSVLSGRGGLDGSERGGGSIGRSVLKSTLDDKHWTQKRLDEMRDRDWRIFKEDYEIAAKGGNMPPPLRSWRESTIPVPIVDALEEVGYKEPTPIQRQAIPLGLQYRDLIGVAETGSGKTASFVIPMLSYVSRMPPIDDENRHLGPYALILAPTRELAQQIESDTRKFAAKLGFTVVSLVGGRDLTEQSFNLRNGAEVVIATPGRLQDCIERHVVVLGQCTFLVLDEADRMVDMGFEEPLNFILDSLPAATMKPDSDAAEDPQRLLRDSSGSLDRCRVTMLYSATMPPTVERIARAYLRRPATVTIGNAGQAVGTVDQQVEFVSSEEQRKKRLLELLDNGLEPPMIVFVNQKKTADMVGRDIRRAGWHVAILHSGLSQTQREEAIASVRDGHNEVLCCTDVGARGIDVPDVSLVVNFQFPTSFPSYIHRIGRTGRAGKTGTAVSFVDEYDEEHFFELRQEIDKSPMSKLSPQLAKHPAAQSRVARDAQKHAE